MADVAKLINDLFRLDADIERAQETLNKMMAKRAMLATVDLPEAMTEIGSSTFTTRDNLRCEVAYKIYGSIPGRDRPDDRFAAIDYLKQHDGAELIKSHVVLTFDKGDIRSANRTARLLKKAIDEGRIHGEELPPLMNVDSEVHPMSLQAWGRQRVRDNIPTDMAVVGLRGQTMATVKRISEK
jgi:hypothetical protein